MSVSFQRESVKDVLEEIKPLLEKHWLEVTHYKDIPLNPDYAKYLKLDEMGMARVFTARDGEKKLIGYSVFFVWPHIHYQDAIYAIQDILFVDPQRRGCGFMLMKWCDEQLKLEGVHVVTQHIKAAHNFGPTLVKLGYELMDLIYVKRLN